MTNTTYSTIINAVDTIIGNITAVKAHYTYEPQQFTAYPAVTVAPVGHIDEFASLRDTKRTYTFIIRVWGKMEDTRTDTQIVIRDLADSIIDTLGKQTNLNLGGAIEWSPLTEGKFVYVQREGSLYVAELTYKAVFTFNRS